MGQNWWDGVRVRVAVQALEVDLGRGQVAIGVVAFGSNAAVGRESQTGPICVLIGVEQDVCAVVLVVTGGVSNGGTRMGAERNLLSRAAVGLQCENVGASACLQIEKGICGCHGVCMCMCMSVVRGRGQLFVCRRGASHTQTRSYRLIAAMTLRTRTSTQLAKSRSTHRLSPVNTGTRSLHIHK
jgi:hypothetical protein